LLTAGLNGRTASALGTCDERALLSRPHAWTPFDHGRNETLSAGGGITVPEVRLHSATHYHLDYLTEVDEKDFAKSAAPGIILRAAQEYLRRGWREYFFQKLLQFGRMFSGRSSYVALRPIHRGPGPAPENIFTQAFPPDPSDPHFAEYYVATIGITVARYTDKPSGAAEQVPEELSLAVTLKRPLDSHGKGIIIELRTYSKDKIMALDAYPELMWAIYTMVFRKLREYPELYDQKIIHTYADYENADGKFLPGVKMYEHRGFEIDPDIPPVFMEGRWWRAMNTSPRTLEAQVFKLRGSRNISGLNQVHPITLPNGQKTFAAAHSELTLDDNEFALRFTPTTEIELAPGVIAAAGSLVNYESSYILQSVSQITKPIYSDYEKRWIGKGAGIVVVNGNIRQWDPSTLAEFLSNQAKAQ
jgi:hypothetical protein